MTTAVEIEHLFKHYRLGKVGPQMLFSDLKNWYSKCFLKKADFKNYKSSYLHVHDGFVNALWDVNLSIKKGEILGIIGCNGAGKSTLLKILSRITAPSSGEVRVRGQVASLLEIGTGFHPELTGRQNIFLNGAINGMRKNTINKKLDSIIDFAGIEKFIDTPVKRYSTGMYVRLAFAVAAHLDSEVILIDEVLAVGDVSFQNKCLGKIDDASHKEGRTILFVSHNLASIKQLCPRSILLDKGRLIDDGPTEQIIDKYIETVSYHSDTVKDISDLSRINGMDSIIKEVWIENESGKIVNDLQIGKTIKLCFKFESTEIIPSPLFGFDIESPDGQLVFRLHNGLTGDTFFNVSKGIAKLSIPELQLMPGNYFLTVFIDQGGSLILDNVERCLSFRINGDNNFNKYPGPAYGYFLVNGSISLIQ